MGGSQEFPVAIIGAGFGGIAAAIRLLESGIDSFTIFERADEIGGTWRDNTYPGAACDVPSHVYSLSFEQNPEWTHRFSPAAEIQAYLLGLVEKWRLRDRLRLGTEIVEARLDEVRGRWALTTSTGETVEARFVIAALGGLVDPALPDIKGLESFGGEVFHTARWQHDVELTGKRVAVIGTGASAVQVVPAIAPQVETLRVFQRTPAWVVPRLDKRYSQRARRLWRRFPFLLHASRFLQYALSELRGPLVFLDAPRLKKLGERMSLRHLEAQVKDPALREKLRPGFPFGCKRILVSDDYWASFERENVVLVTDPIDHVDRDGLVTKDGTRHDADVIVLATGFAVGLVSAPFPVYGRGGRSLDEAWAGGARAYKGMAVSGFPNWFTLMGPNTGPGHTSVLVYTEAQISHALGALEHVRREGLRFVDVRPEVLDRYDAGIQARMKHMVWSQCRSWYLSPDGSNHALYPGFAAEYVLRARRFRAADYESAAA